jgi:MraZ protein
VTKNPAGCLSLYPQPVWDRFEADLIALPESRNALRRLYLGSATEVQIDGSSRVLLPPELREWAGLERDVIFMGMGNSFELWDKARYAAQEAKLLEQDLSTQLDNLHVG